MKKFFISVVCLTFGYISVPAATTLLDGSVAMTGQNGGTGYTVDETVALVKQYCPEWAKKVGEQKVNEVVRLLTKGNTQGKSLAKADLPSFDLTESQEQDLDVFINQVLPLSQYLLANRTFPEKVAEDAYSVENIYTTPKDGCHYGVGDERNTYDPMGIDCEECKANGGKLKANGSYAWGMVAHDGKVYWSTNNNYLCMPGYGQVATGGKVDFVENDCWVCEYEKGTRGSEVGIYGDIVPPRIFEYDVKLGVVKDITPDYELLGYCQGLRSATYHNGVVFFGGPSIKGGSNTSSGSSCFVAYSTKQGKFIGSSDMASVDGCQITNVRRWLVVNDVLYCGVGITDADGVKKGAILRWYGNESDPFNFKIVGYTTGDVAELAYHEGYIYAGTWPSALASTALFRSPVIPEGGFVPETASEWETVWKFSQYEINPASITNAYIGPLCSYKGRLYWGMFGSTYGVAASAIGKYGTLKSAKSLAWMLGAIRPTTFWSSENFNSPDDLELLYGESELPRYDSETDSWTILPNQSGFQPRYGRSGYGNPFTCYTWALSTYNGKMYAGTMDMSDLVEPGLGMMLAKENDTETTAAPDQPGNPGDPNRPERPENPGSVVNWNEVLNTLIEMSKPYQGYECLVMDDPDEPMKFVTDNGFGNPAAYGIRNMIPYDNSLFIGTANPLNLHEDGGWQIKRLTDNSDPSGIGSTTINDAAVIYRQADGYVVISSLKDEKVKSVKVYNASGEQVSSEEVNRKDAYVFTEGFASGVYLIKVETESVQRTIKIAVK